LPGLMLPSIHIQHCFQLVLCFPSLDKGHTPKEKHQLFLSIYEGMGGWVEGILFAVDIGLAAGGKGICASRRKC